MHQTTKSYIAWIGVRTITYQKKKYGKSRNQGERKNDIKEENGMDCLVKTIVNWCIARRAMIGVSTIPGLRIAQF